MHHSFKGRRFAIKSSLRLMAISGVLGVSVLLTACGGGDGSNDETAVVAPVDKYAKVATPTVTKLAIDRTNIAARNYPFLGSDFNLSTFGFVEEEFLFAGKANEYDIANPMSAGGNSFPIIENPTVLSKDNPYKTRMVVIRPSDPAKFNGTVIVEWINATNTFDAAIHWYEQKNMVLRDGYAYVGVSPQDMSISGANGLKAWSPNRYGSIDVTNGGKVKNDSLAYDIFSQAAKAVRADTSVMGGLNVKKVIAVGESQSAMRLSIYLNSVFPNTGNIYDGALVTNSGTKQRTDLSIPIIKILTETEYVSTITNETMILQPDTDKYKIWDVAGSTHSNLTSLLPRAALYIRDLNGRMISDTCAVPMNSRLPLSHIYNAATVRLEEFIANGKPLPTSPRFQYTASATAPSIAVDSYGNAVGGIRHPEIAVPVAVNSGSNAACPGLAGSHVPFTKSVLDGLYPTHADYVSKVTTAANKAVADGFLLPKDAADIIANAESSIWGRKLNCDGDTTGNLCGDRGLFPQTPSILNLRWHMYLYYLPNRADILKPVDEAAIRIASAYNATDSAQKKMYFSQAIALLKQYSDLVVKEGDKDVLSDDAVTYLTGQASLLITELQKL